MQCSPVSCHFLFGPKFLPNLHVLKQPQFTRGTKFHTQTQRHITLQFRKLYSLHFYVGDVETKDSELKGTNSSTVFVIDSFLHEMFFPCFEQVRLSVCSNAHSFFNSGGWVQKGLQFLWTMFDGLCFVPSLIQISLNILVLFCERIPVWNSFESLQCSRNWGVLLWFNDECTYRIHVG
jgi:hypothetical protein